MTSSADAFTCEWDEAARVVARRSLIEFTYYTKPDYIDNWFGTQVAEACDRWLAAVVAGESPRLMLEAPPRHGKSELVSRRLPAYALGRYPEMSFVGTSYGPDLAYAMSADVQSIMDSDQYRELFPGVMLPLAGGRGLGGEKRRTDFWELVGHEGSYRARGVGQGLSGFGGNFLVIDDPFKDLDDARSKAYRERVMRWYRAVATTRLEPGGGIMIMHTRWHMEDLVGQLLEEMRTGEGEDFELIEFPAIATHDEEHRNEGEALVPQRYPIERLRITERVVGPYVWSALYQQRPTVEGGSVFLDEWWEYWDQLPRILYRRIYADTAQKTGERNDYSVFQCWGMGVDKRIYLLDQIRGKWLAPELLTQAVAFWDKWNVKGKDHERTQVMKIEDKVSGTGLIQQLQAGYTTDTRKGGAVPVEAIQRHIDKAIRADNGSPQIRLGRVVLPERAPWLSDYKNEFSNFTKDFSHAYDDQIDPTLDAIEDMLGEAADIYSGAVLNQKH